MKILPVIGTKMQKAAKRAPSTIMCLLSTALIVGAIADAGKQNAIKKQRDAEKKELYDMAAHPFGYTMEEKLESYADYLLYETEYVRGEDEFNTKEFAKYSNASDINPNKIEAKEYMNKSHEILSRLEKLSDATNRLLINDYANSIYNKAADSILVSKELQKTEQEAADKYKQQLDFYY